MWRSLPTITFQKFDDITGLRETNWWMLLTEASASLTDGLSPPNHSLSPPNPLGSTHITS